MGTNRSLRRQLGLALAKAALLTSAFACYQMASLVEGDPTPAQDHPLAVGSPEYLLSQHGCWTGDAPEGATAHHVVVTIKNRTRYAGQRLTDQAVDQEVYGHNHNLIVHGFCR